jgi:ketosteroid isomerase-like protein
MMQLHHQVRLGGSAITFRPPSLLHAAAAPSAAPRRAPATITAAAPSPPPSRRRRLARTQAASSEGTSSPQTQPTTNLQNDDDEIDPGRLADLRAQLALAVRDEDYKRAASLRDVLSKLESDARLALADANAAFYSAFASGDANRMARVWAEGDHVQVVHPGAPPIAGRKAVDASWRAILAGVRPGAFRISAEDVRVVIAGDDVGVVTCVEVVEADDGRGRTVATNVFERVVPSAAATSEGGEAAAASPPGGHWRMTLHHGSPMAMGRR